MKQNNQVPRFAILQYRVLHELDISISEYFLLDMVQHLSGGGKHWSLKKLENIATDMRLSKRGVTVMRDRLIAKGLLKKGVGNRLRTTEKVQKVYFSDGRVNEKSALSSKKVHKVLPKSALSVAKTSVENNSKNYIENRGKKSKEKEHIRKARETGNWSLLKQNKATL